MSHTSSALLHTRVLWELVRYDVLYGVRGLQGVRPPAMRTRPRDEAAGNAVQAAIWQALTAIAPFYWKPILCLQRSVVTARLMRRYGVPAEVVIGYRAKPFFSHAWVEVAGRVVNDSPSYQRRLNVLERL